MNNIVGLSFKVDFIKFRICESCEQCIELTKMKRGRKTKGLKRNPNIHYMCKRTKFSYKIDCSVSLQIH